MLALGGGTMIGPATMTVADHFGDCKSATQFVTRNRHPVFEGGGMLSFQFAGHPGTCGEKPAWV